MPSTACSLQKSCSLLPATPNDGCVVQPDRAHFLTMRLTIPFWACMFPAEELSPLASCDATRRLLRATRPSASFAPDIDHPFLGMARQNSPLFCFPWTPNDACLVQPGCVHLTLSVMTLIIPYLAYSLRTLASCFPGRETTAASCNTTERTC